MDLYTWWWGGGWRWWWTGDDAPGITIYKYKCGEDSLLRAMTTMRADITALKGGYGKALGITVVNSVTHIHIQSIITKYTLERLLKRRLRRRRCRRFQTVIIRGTFWNSWKCGSGSSTAAGCAWICPLLPLVVMTGSERTHELWLLLATNLTVYHGRRLWWLVLVHLLGLLLEISGRTLVSG